MDNEKMLYKLVIQFLIFCQGSHRLLEPHLIQIGKRLKSGATLNDLAPELHAVSKTLLHIAKQPKSEAPPVDEEMPTAADSDDYILQRLDELLIDIDVPLPFHQQKMQLRQRVKGKHGDDSYKNIVDSAINLLLNIKNHTTNEQRGLDSFLSDLSKKLIQIEQQTEVIGDSNRDLVGRRIDFSAAINQQLDNIKHTTQQTEELPALKSLTSQYIDQLMNQILDHMAIENERHRMAEAQLESMTDRLQSLETEAASLRTRLKIEHDRALCDALTGLPNRMAYKERMEMEFNRWRRYRAPLTLVIWDVDFFKRINDEYGHKAGDRTLSLVGQLLIQNCRETDFVARYGGEEFVMLLPNTREDQALTMAENIRLMIEQSNFNSNGETIDLTISCGISEFSGDDQYEEVFVRADQALYQAKQSGRNQCRIFTGQSGQSTELPG